MKKILFIEDESSLQKTFGDILTSEGFKMISAIDGEVGLRLAESEKPDLIILDLVLPKLHGLEVLRGLKENNGTRNIPVIILTNMGDMENIEKALELGATTYMIKADYTLEDVVSKIKNAMAA
ncbi:response regulator [Candidatus Parcubacteria bacterium]|nr:response regulator [Patescibacteria group bacterium]MCG2688508.1 response regulator [Candidatus Parcubacteria bacterium]